jgi:hypothetical protein
MSNGAHYSYMEKQLGHLSDDRYAASKIAPLLDDLKKCFAEEAAHLKTFQKNPLSDQIAAADHQRDQFYLAIEETVRAAVHHPEAARATAASDLVQAFKEYHIKTRGQRDTETGMLDNVIDDMRSLFAKQVSLLGIKAYVDALEQANNQVKTLSAQRAEQQSHVVVGALKNARKATDVAYKAVVAMLNSLMMVEGEAKYKDLELVLNTEIVSAKRQILGIHAVGNTQDDGDHSGDGDNGGEEEPPQG